MIFRFLNIDTAGIHLIAILDRGGNNAPFLLNESSAMLYIGRGVKGERRVHFIDSYIESNILVAWIVIAAAFTVLSKCASLFVETAVAIADRMKIPRLVIGIVLVSLATTMPELTVSVLSAARGKPEIALGNAIGSVICDDGVALALAGLFSAAPIAVLPNTLNTIGIFLIVIEVVAFLFVAFDGVLSRVEGVVLVAFFVLYVAYLYRQHKAGSMEQEIESEIPASKIRGWHPFLIFAAFASAIAGLIVSSEFIVTSAVSIARFWKIPEAVIGSTLIALGTSVPEIATCIVAARKGHGAIAVGNILGADVLNICWIAGASAIVNDLTVSMRTVYYMFPAMFIIVGSMLLMLRAGYRLTRAKSLVLFGLYIVYVASSKLFFPG